MILIELLTYPLGHIVIGSSVHVSRGPLEEAVLSDGAGLSVARVVELVLRLAEVGVIKVGSRLTLVHAHL